MTIWRALAAAGVVAAVAAIVAIYTTALDRVPPYLGHDEVQLELNAQSIAESGRDLDGKRFPLFFSDRALGEYGREPVSIYGTALVVKFLRDDEIAIRLASAIAGLVNIVLMFLVARRHFGGVQSGVAAALCLAFTPLHLFLSRVGIEVIFAVPFVLAWLYGVLADPPAGQRRSLVSIAIASALLALSVYAYKSGQLVAPAFLAASLAFILSQPSPSPRGGGARVTMAAVALGAFMIVVLPYAIASRQHPERYQNFQRVYSMFDPKLTPLQNLRDVVRYDSLADRIGSYFESFNPRLMFFKGEGAWSDSTRLAGMFLLPAAIPLAVGVYAALVWPTRARLLILAGFLFSAIPSFVLNEAVARRMITILPFATLLVVDGFREMWRRRPQGRIVAVAVTIGMAVHFVLFYRDYLTQYPLNSFMAWELNLGDAFRQLAQQDLARGQRDRALVMMDNPYAPDYARLYLKKYGDAALERRTTFRPLSAGAVPPAAEGAALVLRQLFPGEPPASVCTGEWRVAGVVREVVGNPSFVICARP